MKLRDVPSACPRLWRSLRVPPAELRLDLVLSSGQTFRWWESSPGAWTGVLEGRVWTLRQERDRLWYTVYEEEEEDGDACPEKDGDGCPTGAAEPDSAEMERILRDYFQLDVGLPALYRTWGAADPRFRKVAKDFPGVRVLRQDPVECLLSFICTSNNHISRITAMIERLCCAFGRRLCHLNARPIHAFPSLSALTGDFFRGLWGPHAGWAQAVLFCADLRKGQEPRSRGRAKGCRGQDSHRDGAP
ncbi:N-glycosylase/DNA lyase isoform X3 [Patagioenas fasciata]|uniref:N-glycosylase/DNA lyase isoform X3 n=1 Tax=Patagioenas fasciata TaxID=372321 RepID=UPI0032E88124